LSRPGLQEEPEAVRSAEFKSAFLSNNRTFKIFTDATDESHETAFQNLIEMVANIGPIALLGAAIVAALAIGADPISTGDTQTAMPMPVAQG
jgi:hypothetical protein